MRLRRTARLNVENPASVPTRAGLIVFQLSLGNVKHNPPAAALAYSIPEAFQTPEPLH